MGIGSRPGAAGSTSGTHARSSAHLPKPGSTKLRETIAKPSLPCRMPLKAGPWCRSLTRPEDVPLVGIPSGTRIRNACLMCHTVITIMSRAIDGNDPEKQKRRNRVTCFPLAQHFEVRSRPCTVWYTDIMYRGARRIRPLGVYIARGCSGPNPLQKQP